MVESDWLRDALRKGAAGMEIPSQMPATVRRSIRRRRAGGLLAALGIIAAAAIGTAGLIDGITRDRSADVVGEGSNPRVLGRGQDFGVEWELVLSESRNAPCLELQIEHEPLICDELGEEYAPGFEVFPGYATEQKRAYVFGTIPEEGNGVFISLRGGGQWAGLFFEGPPDDDRAYFVRVFSSARVSGVVRQDEGGPAVNFDVRPTDEGATTSTGVADDDSLPGFEGLPGETAVIWTDPIGDLPTGEPHDVVLRTDAEDVCLHIEEDATCTRRSNLTDGLRLTAARTVGKGTVIAGLVGPNVETVVIESATGDRYPQQLLRVRLEGLNHRYFVGGDSAPFHGDLVVTLLGGTTERFPIQVD